MAKKSGRGGAGSEVLRSVIPAAFLAANVAGAQQAADTGYDSGLTEIVVTAQKRSESLQKVPLSITALTSDDLQQRGITGVASLVSGQVPSLKVEPFAGNQSVLEVGIRGFLNPNGTDITNENPVPIYIDDVYYGRQIATALELNDLERVEVLRGPQGTLFGKNAEGGAVRLVSKDPTGELGLNATGEGGNYGYRKGVVHLDLPSVAGIASKFDFLVTDNDGYTTNPGALQHAYGITQAFGGKLTLLYRPTDSMRIEYAGDYTDLRTTEMWNAQVSTTDPYNSVWPNQTTFPHSEPYATYRPLDPQLYWGHRLNASLELNDNITLKSITAFRVDSATIYNTAANSSVVPGPFFSPGFNPPAVGCLLGPAICGGLLTGVVPITDYTHRQLSEELQLTGTTDEFQWVSGLFFIHEHGAQNETTYFDTLLPGSLGAGPGFFPLTPSSSALLSERSPGFGPVGVAGANVAESSYAIFGQATYRPEWAAKKLGVTAGMRIGRDDKSATRPAPGEVYPVVTYPLAGQATPPPGAPCPATPGCSPSISHTRGTPMASVSYDWTDTTQTYLRFSTGYQAPGLSVGSQTFKYVDASSVKAYEFGVKSELLNRKLRANLAAFYLEWRDPQENVQTVSSSTVEFFSGTPIYIHGAEFELTYLPIEALKFDASLSVLRGSQSAQTNPFAPSATTGTTQVPLNLVALPHWAAALSGTYDMAKTDKGTFRITLDTNGTAGYFSVPNAPPIEGYWLTNARFSVVDIPIGGGTRMEVSIWGRNLADRSYRSFQYEAPGTVPGTFHVDSAYGLPRTYGGTLSIKF